MKPHRLAALLAALLIPGPLAAGQGEWLIREIPRHIKNDLVESFLTPAHVWAFAGGLALTVGMGGLDDGVQRGLEPGDSLGSANKVLDVMGNNLLLDGASLVGFGISKLAEVEKPALTFGTMLEALLITQALTYGVKVVGGRRRPDGSDDLSFPSGHTSSAFTLAAVSQSFYGPLWGVPSFALASTIGFSRIDANEHFLTDVVFGALLGTLVGLGTARFHKKVRPDFFVIPTAAKNSAGVAFVFTF